MRRSFNDLYAFVMVARHGSFTKAAAHMGMSQSALSQTVRNLEEQLGVRLLARSTRSVATTDAGARLLARIAPQFQEMLDAIDDLNDVREKPRGLIRISAGEHAAVAAVQPKLAPFLAQYPDVEIEVLVDGGMIDIVAGGFDAGVRFGRQVARDMIAVRISPDVTMAVVGAPGYLADNPPPVTPEALSAHRCIRSRLPTHGEIFSWPLAKAGEIRRVRVEGPLVVNSLALRLAGALSGIGLAFVPLKQVAAHIEAGHLVPVLEDWWPVWEGYHLYYPSRRQHSLAFRLLVDALRARPAQHE